MSEPGEKVAALFKAAAGGGKGKPEGGNSGSALMMVIVLGVIGWGVLSSYYTVQPEERAVVKRFGKVVSINDPGLHFKLPFGVDSVQKVATERVMKQEFGFRTASSEDERSAYSTEDFPDESLMLSGDLNIIDVEWVVQYRIGDPMKYLYAQRDPDRTLRDLSESVMRRVVGNRLGSEVLTTARVAIAAMAREEIQKAMLSYDNGIHVVTVELQDVVPPAAVQPAFNEVNEARQERERMINEATKQANQEIPKARGEANRVLSEAQGYATERINYAKGESARFNSILAEYRSAPEVTRTRMYLETLTQVLPTIGSVLVVQEGQTGPLPIMPVQAGRKQEAAQ